MDDERSRFLDSDVPDPLPKAAPFEALSRQGSSHYVGLETFENPGIAIVHYTSDEVMSKCPITGQPDFYTVKISLLQPDKCLESKSLKLFFQNIITASFTNDFGIFCESLAVYIRDQVMEVTDLEEDKVRVEVIQKSRGGISINAVA